jgi:hypothetical protein
MRRLTGRSGNAWRQGGTGAEYLGVDAIVGDAGGHKACRLIAHETRWSADVEITISRQAELFD